MNEETGTQNAAESGEAAMDAQGAAVIMERARERAGSELRVRRPLLFVSWGLVLLVGYGAMWLSVRGQQPYHMPAWPTLLLAFLLLLVALIITAQVVDWAASGVGGRSQVQRGIFALAVAAGSTWGGPATALAVCALAGGGGVLLMAVIEPRLRRS